MKYIDLHIHSEYTKNNGISKIDALISKAKNYEMDSLSLVDSGTLSGISEFYIKCIQNNIKPIIGLGFYFTKDSRFSKSDEKYHLVILAENNTGFKNLLKLAELSFTEGFYKRPRIDFEILEKYNEGLVALTGGLGGLIDKLFLADKNKEALEYIDKFISIFGKDNFFLEIQNNGLKENIIMKNIITNISKEKDINTIITGGSFYTNKEDFYLCNELRLCHGNKELKGDSYYFKSPTEIISRFPHHKEAIKNTVSLSQRLNVQLDITKLEMIDAKNSSDLENILAMKNLFFKNSEIKDYSSIIIESKRLIQISINEKYIDDIFKNFTNEITKYMIPQPSSNIEDTVNFIKSSIIDNRNKKNIQLVILDKNTNEFLGCSGLHFLEKKSPHLGIWLKKSAHKKSYGYEAITAIINWVKESLDYTNLSYPVDKNNYPSKLIPIKHNATLNKEYKQKTFHGNILNILDYDIKLK